MHFRSVVLVALLVAGSAAVAAGQPLPSVSTTFIDFGTIPASSMLTKSFWVRNAGDTTLYSLISSTDAVRFAPAPTFIQVPAGDSAQVDVTFDPINFGEHSATVLVRNIGALPESLFVDVTGIGGPETPALEVTPTSFNVTMYEDQVEVRTLRITNTGGGTLNWYINEQPAPVTWLAQYPQSGTLPTAAFVDVDVTFYATLLTRGLHSTTMRVGTTAGNIDVPVTVLVVGAPNITVSPTALDFGRVYNGFSLDRRFTITNSGTAVLDVDTLRITGGTEYTILPPELSLQPGEWQEVTVTFTPTTVGQQLGLARIESNDPDQPLINVSLSGEGSDLSPPAVSVAPDTIEFDVFTGEIAMGDIVVGNNGGDALVWTASVEWINPDPFPGLSIMVDHSHGDSDFLSQSSNVITALTNAGAIVNLNYNPISLALLRNYDVLFIPGKYTIARWSSTEIAAARDYVHALGGILVDATSANAIYNANAVSGALGTGITAGWQSGSGNIFTGYIQPSPMTQGIDMLHLEYGTGITSLSSPGLELVRYDQLLSRRHSAYAEAGGRFMVSGDEFHSDVHVTEPNADNLSFAMQVFAWLGRAPSVTIDNTGSTVAVGASDTIGVVFDATLLAAGYYPSRVVIESNDPVSQTVSVPVLASVTGTSLIEVSDTSLAFDDRYLGITEERFVTIGNLGLEPLTISGISLPDPNFSWRTSDGVPPIGIGSAAVETLYVTFNPLTSGLHEAELTITSSAYNAPSLGITVSGTGIDPVALSADPDSIHVNLLLGDTASVALAVHNAATRDETVRLAYHETTGAPAQPNVLFDNFEDADFNGWSVVFNAAVKAVVGTGGGNNSVYCYRESNAESGHYTGIYRDLPGLQPRAMSFWVRPDRDDQYTNYVTLRDGAGLEVAFFFATGNATFYVNANVGGNQAYPYTAGQWYHVEYRDIDWLAKHFDYVVNDSLVQADVPMRNAADVTEVSRLDLYHFEAGGAGDFDDIWMDYTDRPAWLSVTPGVGTSPGGGSAPFAADFSTAGLAAGTYSALVSFAGNDPFEPLLTVPVVMVVDSTATAATLPLPRRTALLQNVPNPFNPTTTIRFELAQPAEVRLEIYSVRGARIRTLVSGRRPAGSHAVEWDGRDRRGAAVASGVYFYRLEAGSFAETRKMVLLK